MLLGKPITLDVHLIEVLETYCLRIKFAILWQYEVQLVLVTVPDLELGHLFHDAGFTILVHEQVEIPIVKNVEALALMVINTEGELERILVVVRNETFLCYSLRLDPVCGVLVEVVF